MFKMKLVEDDTKYEIGFVAGAFPVIHLGYKRLFDKMLDVCNHPYVLLQEDPTIERPEKMKPFFTVDERIEMIRPYFDFYQASFLIYNTEAELLTIIKALRPDVRFLGDDYVGKEYTGSDLGIPVEWIDRSHGWSTTEYFKKVSEVYAGTKGNS